MRRPLICCVGPTRLRTYTFLVIYVLSGTADECQAVHFYPFPEFSMRRGVPKKQSVGQFKKRVGLTDKINTQRNRRGGIRL